MKPEVEAILADYLAEVIEGNAAVFAGAGLSIPAGFVDWRELIRPLCVELGLTIELENDYVAVAQFHVNANARNRHKLHTAIIDALSTPRTPSRNHKLLARLPIATWWTTNYDKLIEAALTEVGKVVDVKSAGPQLPITRRGRDVTLYKMHGDVDRPDEAIVTRDDYESYNLKHGAFVNALAGDLTEKTFLFLGFSFTDPNLAHVLSILRLRFEQNQRRHYAIFKTRSKLPKETRASFEHFKIRQALVIEDLKRYNIKVLLVEEYEEIGKFLEELVSRYRRKTVFVSGSADDFGPWGRDAVGGFCQELGARLVRGGSRVVTGLGLGVGDSVFTGALREAMLLKTSFDDALVARPFPHRVGAAEKAAVWDKYRSEMISHAGICLFIFGNRAKGVNIHVSKGVLSEFEIGQKQGAVLLPIGATGFAAKELSKKTPSELGLEGEVAAIEELGQLAHHTSDLVQLVDRIARLIEKLQKGSS